MYISHYLVVAMEIQVGKEEVKEWWFYYTRFYYTFHTNPPPEPVPQLFSVPSELVFSERIPELVDTFYFPSELGPELISEHELTFYELFPIPYELEPDTEHLVVHLSTDTFCSADLCFGNLAWTLSALGDFLEVEMVESQFSQR